MPYLKPVIKELERFTQPELLFSRFAHLPYPFFLVSGGAGRYSFLGAEPFLVLKSKGDKILIESRDGRTTHKTGNPLEELRKVVSRYRIKGESEIPFMGGAVGYFGYDLCHFIEKLPRHTKDDLKFPDMFFAFYDRFVAIDHHNKRCYQINLHNNLQIPRYKPQINPKSEIRNPKSQAPHPASRITHLKSNFTKPQYLSAVRRVKEYILAGDIYQANLSQRFETAYHNSALDLYRHLLRINPASFSALLNPNPHQAVISSSPELFLRIRGDKIETRPIKGTRPRGRNAAQDKQLKQELSMSIKDNAELAMIVDLERNDLGRVCKYNSVKVTRPKVIETYPTVHHLVSTVTGVLKKGCDVIDVIKATFPGGSITGAPKIRAMEIIDEIEPTARNVYTGAIGYLGFNGNIDLSIAIRIIMLNRNKAYVPVGGGIVADSDPEAEYAETLTKGKALVEALTDGCQV
ncbi:MAG: aminodeoxychorismate synthase component I [Planctomycetes bacterium]|nr:aminodeoxychorismate synthase component I [Planctomycetota bacterium]